MKIALFLVAVVIIANIVFGDASAMNIIDDIDIGFIFMSKIMCFSIAVFITVTLLVVLMHLFSEYAYPETPDEDDSENVEHEATMEEDEADS